MIGQEFVINDVRMRANEGQHRADMLLVVVHAGNERCARHKLDIGERLVGPLEVFKNARIAHAGPFLVALGVGELVVVQHHIHVRQQLFVIRPRDVAGGLDGGVDAALMRLVEQRRAEVGLDRALAAAEGDAAARLTVKVAVLLHLGEHLVHGHFLAEQVQRFRRADFGGFDAAAGR